MEPHRGWEPPPPPEELDRWSQRLAILKQLWPAIDAVLLALDQEEECSILMPHTLTVRDHLRALVRQYQQT